MRLITAVVLVQVLLAGVWSAAFADEREGSEGGGGGNAQVAEFYSMARGFAHFLDVTGGKPYLPPQAGGYGGFVASVKIQAVRGPLELQGSKVDAINYPAARLIKLDDQTWALRSRAMRYQIVIHEFLGLLEVTDPNFERSQALAQESIGMLGSLPGHGDAGGGGGWNAPVKYRSITTNFDGSITIKAPLLRYESRFVPIAAGLEIFRPNCTEGDYFIPVKTLDFPDSATGLCVLFGRSASVRLTYSRHERGMRGYTDAVAGIELTKAGRFQKMRSSLWTDCLGGGDGKYAVLQTVSTITCR